MQHMKSSGAQVFMNGLNEHKSCVGTTEKQTNIYTSLKINFNFSPRLSMLLVYYHSEGFKALLLP